MTLRPEVGDYRYKAIILGKVGVGKTSLFIRIRDDKFVEASAQSTVGGTDVFTYTTTVGEDRVTVSVPFFMLVHVCSCLCVCVYVKVCVLTVQV